MEDNAKMNDKILSLQKELEETKIKYNKYKLYCTNLFSEDNK